MKKFAKAALAVAVATLSLNAAAATVARMGTSLPDAHPQTLGAKKFAELVKERSDGEIRIQVFGSGILGNDVNMTSMLQAGTLDFTAPSTATLASLNPDFSVVSLPFQFTSHEQADAVLDGPVGQSLLDSLDGKGLVALNYWENGFRHITNSRRAIENVDDFDGLKMRTMQNNLYIDLFNGLDANAVPMPINELFTALETRTVDGQENPFTVINAQHFYEVQGHLSLTGHAYDAQVLLASQKFMDRLSAEDRELVVKAARDATLYQRQISRDMNNELLDELKGKMQVNEVSLAEREKMAEKLSPVVKKHQAAIAPEVVTAFNQALTAHK